MTVNDGSNGYHSSYGVGYDEGVAVRGVGQVISPRQLPSWAEAYRRINFPGEARSEFVRGFVDGYLGHPYRPPKS